MILSEIRTGVEEIIAAGEGLSLWRWRNPFLLQWRRGVRGLEYSTLSVMTREIRNRLLSCDRAPGGDAGIPAGADPDRLRRELLEIRRLLDPFVAKVNQLLELERGYMQTGMLSPLQCDDGEIRDLRRELFGSAMSHGGTFKGLIDAVDRLWLGLIRGGDHRRTAVSDDASGAVTPEDPSSLPGYSESSGPGPDAGS